MEAYVRSGRLLSFDETTIALNGVSITRAAAELCVNRSRVTAHWLAIRGRVDRKSLGDFPGVIDNPLSLDACRQLAPADYSRNSTLMSLGF